MKKSFACLYDNCKNEFCTQNDLTNHYEAVHGPSNDPANIIIEEKLPKFRRNQSTVQIDGSKKNSSNFPKIIYVLPGPADDQKVLQILIKFILIFLFNIRKNIFFRMTTIALVLKMKPITIIQQKIAILILKHLMIPTTFILSTHLPPQQPMQIRVIRKSMHDFLMVQFAIS